MDPNFLKLFDRRPISLDWEVRRIQYQYTQKMSLINHILKCVSDNCKCYIFLPKKNQIFFFLERQSSGD